ncbi:hypothetical protein [Oleiharenicola lentus]|uniref:hypothetical protein n=1 Tax=Oleiharenicola lentus TaxID=2508720 RepID=UPI003F6732A4
MSDKSDNSGGKSYGDAVRSRRVTAGVLLVVAAVALLSRYVPLNWRDSFLPLIGVGFIVWAGLSRTQGLLVPGCILVGVGTGIMLRGAYGNEAFLFSMAGGFLLISVVTKLMFPAIKGCWWTIWPAAGLAFAGVMAASGPNAREWWRSVRPLWPWVLVAVAVFLLLTKPRGKV